FSEGTLEISAQTPDIGEASESLPVPFNGEPLEIGFNPDFLREGLESAETDELVFKLISPLRPGLIESAVDGEGAGSFQYLVCRLLLEKKKRAARRARPRSAAHGPEARAGTRRDGLHARGKLFHEHDRRCRECTL